MAYKVLIHEDARYDLDEAAAFIVEKETSLTPARRWLAEMQKAVAELKRSPLTFSRIPEEFEGSERLREVHRYSHRIIYSVDEDRKVVHVLRIYHSSRRPLTRRHIRDE